MIRLSYACPACGRAVEGDLEAGITAMPCRDCAHVTPLPEAPSLSAAGRVDRCPVCGSQDLYVQRDFNRPLGLVLAGIGLALGPFTSWISTVVAILVDAGLYLVVPLVAVCYACNAQFRGFDRSKGPGPFDIAVHDAYKFGKRHPPRRDAAVAGPLRARLRNEGRAP